MKIAIGVQVSLDNSTWYKLSDHSRSPIQISYENIETSQRMASGKLRKYVIASKRKISTDWQNLPSLDSNVVDYSAGGHGAAWMKSFYDGNVFLPIYVKLIYAKETTATYNAVPVNSTYSDSFKTTGDVFQAYMTGFTYDVQKRMVSSSTNTGYDYVNVKIDFTEI